MSGTTITAQIFMSLNEFDPLKNMATSDQFPYVPIIKKFKRPLSNQLL